MKPQKSAYRKNFPLIIAFLVLISITLVVALVGSYNLTSTYVESEFSGRKIDVLEETVKPYNDFFQNRIPQITSYQGYLTNASASDYADSVFTNYAFVRRIIFYDIAISSKKADETENKLSIGIDTVYQYHRRHHQKGVASSLNTPHADEED